MNTEKIKRFLIQKKALIVSAISFALIVCTIFTLSFFTDDTKAVALVVDGEKDVYKTEAATVKGFLEEQNIELSPEDKVSVELHSPIEDQQVIEINTAVNITIIDHGISYQEKVQPGKVDDILNITGHARGANDWVTPKYDTYANEGTVIRVDRISYAQADLKESTEPETIEQKNPNMPAGTINTLQEGMPGVDSVTYESVYKNGTKIRDIEISRTTLQEPKDKIVEVGTKTSAPVTAAPSAVDLKGNKCITVSATAYTHTGNRTATGTVARVGIIAVDPKVIPLGTKVYVEGYGYAVAEDTGGAIKGNRIDIFLNTNRECINWGRRQVKVYIVD